MAKKKTNENMESKDKDPRTIAIGAKLKAMRIEKGYAAAEFFAWENKIPHITYVRLESGTNFTIGTLLKVLDAHGITMSEFFKDLS